MNEAERPIIICEVLKCPRCGQDHGSMHFVALPGTPIDFDGVATHWISCPDTGSPIVLYNMPYIGTGPA